jgi:hypothetical protein
MIKCVATWGELYRARPDIATKGHQLFYEYGVGIGFLATVRPDGGPRVHPISPLMTDRALLGLIIPGPKLNDLRRDRRYALHSSTFAPPRQDHAFYVVGTATEVTDPVAWERAARQFLAEREIDDRWPGFESQVLFEFEVERCLLTLTSGEDGLPAGHTLWLSGEAIDL